MRWEEFVSACPRLARLGQTRFAKDQLVFVGTLRKDGWPRISPCEVDIAAGHLLLGMMWRSAKALDLLRDSRVAVHSVTCDREGGDGDLKLYGRAVDIRDAPLRETYRRAITARIGWAPDEPSYHLFSIDIERAAFIKFGRGKRVMVWDTTHGLRTRPVPH